VNSTRPTLYSWFSLFFPLLVLTLVAQGAGFSAKDRAVLLGAVASVERAAASAKAGRAVSERPCR
jgi:K+ transporter